MNKKLFYLFVAIVLLNSCNKESNKNDTPISVSDVDGNVYNTLTIGTQVWMRQNLKTTHYQNGDSIIEIIDNAQWLNDKKGAFCNYNNDIENVDTFGHLYNWYAVNNPNGLCPSGWHIPSDSEWNILVNYLGGQSIAGGATKEISIWDMPNTDATNSSELTVIPAGGRYENGIYSGLYQYAAFWSSTEYDSTDSWYDNMNFNNAQVYRYFYPKSAGYSCRCIFNK